MAEANRDDGELAKDRASSLWPRPLARHPTRNDCQFRATTKADRLLKVKRVEPTMHDPWADSAAIQPPPDRPASDPAFPEREHQWSWLGTGSFPYP